MLEVLYNAMLYHKASEQRHIGTRLWHDIDNDASGASLRKSIESRQVGRTRVDWARSQQGRPNVKLDGLVDHSVDLVDSRSDSFRDPS